MTGTQVAALLLVLIIFGALIIGPSNDSEAEPTGMDFYNKLHEEKGYSPVSPIYTGESPDITTLPEFRNRLASDSLEFLDRLGMDTDHFLSLYDAKKVK